MASLDINDGRPGDGVDLRRTAFEYDGLKFDRLHPRLAGFATVTGDGD